MGKVLITGAGHSGTNLVLEGLRASGAYKFYPDDGLHTEDRAIEARIKVGLCTNYGTKLCTENTMITPKFLKALLDKYEDMSVVFCLRNPIDVSLARIHKFNGEAGYDADGNIKQLNHTADILDFLFSEYPYRIHLVFMPDLLMNYEAYMKLLSLQLDIKYNREMSLAYKNMRIEEKKRKYQGEIDLRQCNLRENEKELFGDYWKQSQPLVWKMLIEGYFGKGASIWKDRPTYAFWSVLMGT